MKQLLLIIAMLPGFQAFSQTGLSVFNDTLIHTLRIDTELEHWFDTLEHDFDMNMADPENYPERYHKCKVTWDNVILSDCGFREKGNSSNTMTTFGRKKPLKISFDEFVSQELDGLKKINLNNFTNDPSLLHDVISLKLLRDAGLVASRTSFTKVWVNGEYIGLYLVIENVDKTFLKSRYGSSQNDGNLYKTDRGASVPLNWMGPEPEPYKTQGLKLTTNESEDNWSQLISFIDHLNNDDSPDFRQYLETKFDVHAYLKVLAIEKCIRSWDSYWGGGNNFYLYEHPDGKYRWIPWDMNETFQDIKVLSGTSLLDGYLVPANKFDERPLIRRIFEQEDWKQEYLDYCCSLINEQFTLEHLGEFILDRHRLVDETYRDDPNRYNSYESFRGSLTDYNEDAVSLTHSGFVLRLNYPGIFPFIQSQREWAVKQMSGWDHACSTESQDVYNLPVFPNPASGYVNIANGNTGFEYAQLRLYDFSGRLVKATEFTLTEGSHSTLELEGIPSGIYLLVRLSADGRTGRAKLVVSRQ